MQGAETGQDYVIVVKRSCMLIDLTRMYLQGLDYCLRDCGCGGCDHRQMAGVVGWKVER